MASLWHYFAYSRIKKKLNCDILSSASSSNMNAKKQQFLLFRVRVHKDPKAFEEIYLEYTEGIRRFFIRKLPTVQDAEDASATTFVRLWAYLQTAEVESLSGLIFTIARTTIAEFYKFRKQTVSLEMMEEESGQELKSRESPEKILFRADVALLKRALEKLEETDQQVLVWRYIEDVSVKEIAARIFKTQTATSMTISRAIKKLREIIDVERQSV